MRRMARVGWLCCLTERDAFIPFGSLQRSPCHSPDCDQALIHAITATQLSSAPSRACTLSQQQTTADSPQPPVAMADSAAALRSAGATAAGTTGASIGSLNPSARAPLPHITDMTLSILIGGEAHSAAHAASAEAASAAAAASAATAAAPAVPAPPTPLHLLPPRDIQQMLDYQARA